MQYLLCKLLFIYCVGMATRAIGIMPEKAMKMQTWSWVHGYLERKNEGSIYTNLIVAGAFAGAATTVVGKRLFYADTLAIHFIHSLRLSIRTCYGASKCSTTGYCEGCS